MSAATALALVLTFALLTAAEAFYLESAPFHGYHAPLPYVPTPTLNEPHAVYCGQWSATRGQLVRCLEEPMPR